MNKIVIFIHFVSKTVCHSSNRHTHNVTDIKNISSILDSLVFDGNDEIIIISGPIT